MEMRNKDGTNFGEMHMRTSQLYLRTLATIHHEHLPPHLNNLGGGIMLKGGQRTATPQYMYFE